MSDYDGRGGPSGSGTQPGQPAGKDGMAAEYEAVPDLTVHYGVGDELRMRRESMGKSITDVADAIRIQKRYLEALEQGKLDHLPGTVYALGFVRTYAEHLGFSGAEMVARYKEETTGLKTQSYMMPEPLEEGKVPTAAILLVAVLMAAIGYGVWYYLSQEDSRFAQQVPDVPERLAPTAEQPAATLPEPLIPAPAETAAPLPPTQPAPAAAPSALSQGDTPPPVAAAETQPPASAPVVAAPEPQPAAPVEPQPAAPVEPPAAAPTEPQAAAPSEPQPAAPSEPQAAAPSPPQAAATEEAAQSVAETQPPPVAGAGTPEAVAEESAAAQPVEEEPREPRTYGLGNTDARIIITATEDAWLEVTDAEEALLFSRVLRKGDTYRAPTREGAKFVTGNAGGLEIRVDDEVVPSLGPSGQVRRNVKLDPDLLKAGKAWP